MAVCREGKIFCERNHEMVKHKMSDLPAICCMCEQRIVVDNPEYHGFRCASHPHQNICLSCSLDVQLKSKSFIDNRSKRAAEQKARTDKTARQADTFASDDDSSEEEVPEVRDSAGASLTDSPPFVTWADGKTFLPKYDTATIKDIKAAFDGEITKDVAAKVKAYEILQKNRKTLVQWLEFQITGIPTSADAKGLSAGKRDILSICGRDSQEAKAKAPQSNVAFLSGKGWVMGGTRVEGGDWVYASALDLDGLKHPSMFSHQFRRGGQVFLSNKQLPESAKDQGHSHYVHWIGGRYANKQKDSLAEGPFVFVGHYELLTPKWTYFLKMKPGEIGSLDRHIELKWIGEGSADFQAEKRIRWGDYVAKNLLTPKPPPARVPIEY